MFTTFQFLKVSNPNPIVVFPPLLELHAIICDPKAISGLTLAQTKILDPTATLE
jgi:hypothetical protein